MIKADTVQERFLGTVDTHKGMCFLLQCTPDSQLLKDLITS